MSWRKPRERDEAVPTTCDDLRELAEAYHPFVAFASAERFFPALAESWLTHATHAAWPAMRKRPGFPLVLDRPTDPFRRGTAVCTAPEHVRSVQVLGGTPNDDDRPIQLTDQPGDPDSIASYRDVDGSTFLSFGGWADRGTGPGFQGRGGDLDYLYRAFSELASAMDPANPWQPVELLPHLPQPWTTQPPTPTTYCEARWVKDFAELSEGLEAPDFPPGSADLLGDHLALTYHYLFPAREASDGEPEVRPQEGQWAAVSLIFQGKGEGGEGVFFEPPVAVAVSQGTDGGEPLPFISEVKRWADVSTAANAPTHPVLTCSRGTHRFFFAPLADTPWGPGGAPGGTSDAGGYDNNSDFPGFESILVGGLILASLFLPFGPVGWVIAAVIAILAILLWLISVIADLCNDDAENPANPWPTNPESGGDGPWGGDDAEPPAPGGQGGSGDPGGPGGGTGWGLPNSGSPSGADTVSFDVRFVDLTRPRDRRTGYPSEEPCEWPTWWDYAGRWGVRVPAALDGTWASGSQRIDEHGRCWGYWLTLRFLRDVLVAP